MHKYKRSDGACAERPPVIEVREDAKAHAEEVRAAYDRPSEARFNLMTRGVHKSYPKARYESVHDLTLGVEKGEVYGILGPNGAGKSTTFNMLSMQTNMTEGQGCMLEHDIASFPASSLGKLIGICNQGNLIWENLTVDESLDVVAGIKGLHGPRR